MKTARDELDIINAYEETGSLRAAAALCGTTHKTVRRVLERRVAGQRPGRRRVPRPGLADEVTDVIYTKVKATDGRISAKRLLPVVRAAGYTGSARTLRRAVAVQKARWRRARRVYRPWTPEPGQHLLIDRTRPRPPRDLGLADRHPTGSPHRLAATNTRPGVSTDQISFTTARREATRSMIQSLVTATSSPAALAEAADHAARGVLSALVTVDRDRHSPRRQKHRPKFPHTATTKPTTPGPLKVNLGIPEPDTS